MVGDFGGNEAWLYIAECEFVVGDSVAGAGRRLGLGLFFRWLSGILSFFGGCGLFSSTFLLSFFSFSSEWRVCWINVRVWWMRRWWKVQVEAGRLSR